MSKSTFDFSKNYNPDIEKAVDDCVNGFRAERNRQILKRYLIDGVNYEPLAEEFGLSVQRTKDIVYKLRWKIYHYLNL